MSTEYRVSDDVVSRTVQGEEVIVDLLSGTYFGLNKTGTQVWKSLVEGRSQVDITSEIVESFDVSSEEASRDVASLIKEFEEKKFISRT